LLVIGVSDKVWIPHLMASSI